MPKQAPPAIVRIVDSPEVSSAHAGDAVVARQTLVYVGVTGAEQIEYAAVLTNQAAEE